MGTQVTLTIPDKLYRRAQQVARMKQQDVSEVLVEAIQLTDVGEGSLERETAVAREEAAFQQLHPKLWQQYPGQYVAIHDGQLVDHDTDQVTLFLRMREQYPDEFVWIAPVQPQAQEEYHIRSPRLISNLE
ncbi:MAG: hypothetical protein H6658_19700 [Ardenticatenaceae bacterium]|nr:hypothetical protein [Ardenticatenaceae bacterium]